MIRWLCSFVAAVALSTTATAQDSTDPSSVTGKELPPLKRPPAGAQPNSSGPKGPMKEMDKGMAMSIQEYMNREYEPEAYLGAKMADLDPKFVHLVREGLELIYLRRYSDARTHFKNTEKEFPNTGVAAVADTLVWQALMLENFDYQYDKQYWEASKKARADLEKAMSLPGGEPWEHFLMAGVTGIEAIHTMRQSKYLPALQLAFEAMDHIGTVRKKAPDFTDMLLADGMYNYWRTAITMNSSVLPDFGDHRVEGIEQMQKVDKQGVFIRPAAGLALAFTWMEEGDKKRALSACLKNRRLYPDNVINNLMTGSTYVYMGELDKALGVFEEILVDDPENKRARYWRGVVLLKKGELDKAEKDFKTYLGFDYMEDYQRAAAHHRLGQVYKRKKLYKQAEEQWKAAVKLSKHKPASRALDKLKEQKKSGKISY